MEWTKKLYNVFLKSGLSYALTTQYMYGMTKLYHMHMVCEIVPYTYGENTRMVKNMDTVI